MAVDPNIKKKADDIRTKVYGKEVRESLASGLEEMSSDVVQNEGRQSVVEGRQDSVESQWQAVSDEMTDKDVISAPEIIAARDGEENLKARLDKGKNEVTTQLAQKGLKASGGLLTGYWQPKLQQNVNQYVPGSNRDVSLFYSEMWDTLLSDETFHVTKKTEGRDSSGEYDIYSYTYHAPTPEREIVLVGALHGTETLPIVILFNLMIALRDDYLDSTELTYLREKVNIIIIPIANPWGVVNDKRHNANGIDLNRNFDNHHQEFNETETTRKGPHPLSEIESRIIRDVIVNSNATAVIDVHNTNSNPNVDYYASGPKDGMNKTNMIADIINRIKPINNPKVLMTQSIEPTLVNWADRKLNKHAVNIEWVLGAFGNVPAERQDMTEALKWVGNTVVQMVKLPKKETLPIDEIRAVNVGVDKTISFTNTEYESIPFYELNFKSKSRGFIKVDGHMVVATTAKQRVFVHPTVSQTGQGTITDGHQESTNSVYQTVPTGTEERSIISFSTLQPVFPTDNNGYSDITIKIRTKQERGDEGVSIIRLNYNAIFVSTNGEIERYIHDEDGLRKVL